MLMNLMNLMHLLAAVTCYAVQEVDVVLPEEATLPSKRIRKSTRNHNELYESDMESDDDKPLPKVSDRQGGFVSHFLLLSRGMGG